MLLKDKKNILGLVVFGLLVLIFVLIFGKLDEPEISYDAKKDPYSAKGIVLLNMGNQLVVRPIDGIDNITLAIENPSIQEGDFINFDYIDNYDVEDYETYSEINVNIIKYNSYNYYEEKLITNVRDLEDYGEFNLPYNNEYFDEKNVYIARKNGCPNGDTFSTYYKNNTIYFLEDDYTGVICTQEVDYEYYIIEVDKEYRIKKNERISSTFNRTSFYSEFSNNYRLDIYLFKKNNNYVIGFLGDTDNTDIIPYLRSLPLTIEEARDLYQRLYKNKNYRVINYDNLSMDEVELVKRELGVE